MGYPQSRANGETSPIDNISPENVAAVCVRVSGINAFHVRINLIRCDVLACKQLSLWKFQIKVLLQFEKMLARWAYAFQHPPFFSSPTFHSLCDRFHLFSGMYACVRAGVSFCILAKHKNSPLKVFHLTDWKITLCGNRGKKWNNRSLVPLVRLLMGGRRDGDDDAVDATSFVWCSAISTSPIHHPLCYGHTRCARAHTQTHTHSRRQISCSKCYKSPKKMEPYSSNIKKNKTINDEEKMTTRKIDRNKMKNDDEAKWWLRLN